MRTRMHSTCALTDRACAALSRPRPQILLGTGFPIRGGAKQVLGGAVLLQLLYDWYWNARLRRSWLRRVPPAALSVRILRMCVSPRV
jgi:hypothetical protein